MSKKSRRRRDLPTPISIANPPVAYRLRPVVLSPIPSLPLTEFEDRRKYHPLGPMRGAVSFSGAQHGLRLVDRPQRDRFAGLRKFASQTKATIGFDAPLHTLVCVRRRRRKEVLFAKRKAGRAGARSRRPRRNWFSQIHC